MPQNEFKKALRNCRAVYGYVRFNDDHGEYVRLYKHDVVEMMAARFDTDEDIDANLCTDGGLYIN